MAIWRMFFPLGLLQIPVESKIVLYTAIRIDQRIL